MHESNERQQLLVDIARMYYFENLSQQQIADTLHMSRSNISLLLKSCLENHIIEIKINDTVSMAHDVASQIKARFGRQNVLIARALMTNPELLILDEPCTGLDVFSREYLLSTLRDLAQNTDVTIIFVTHYTEEILDIFPNCLLLKNGRIYAKDRTDQIFTSERLSEFLNYPVTVSWQNNRIQVRLEVDSHIKTLLQNNPSADSSSEYKQLCIQSDSNC